MGSHKFSYAYAAEVVDTACYSVEGHAASGKRTAEDAPRSPVMVAEYSKHSGPSSQRNLLNAGVLEPTMLCTFERWRGAIGAEAGMRAIEEERE